MTTDSKKLIEDAWEDRQLLEYKEYQDAIEMTILKLDRGQFRVAEPIGNRWHVNEWLKKALILYAHIRKMVLIDAGPFVFHDKMKLKTDFKETDVRVVSPAIARYGAFLGRGVIMLPSYVNIGAFVDEGTMIESWTTVGSCAQIGKSVHISGGVTIGSALYNLKGSPVIIEDHCFISPRCIINEGVQIETEAILGANLVLSASTKIIDVTGETPVEYKSVIPARSIVIAGSVTQKFASGEYQIPCALIVGKRKDSADKKMSLDDAFRNHNIAI